MQQMTLTGRTDLGQAERVIRNHIGRAGQIWVFADPANLRRVRKLAARFRRNPVPGADVWFSGPPPLPPRGGRAGEGTVADGGGLLVISAGPFPGA